MNWDTENLTSSVCDIATARRTADGVVLDFGMRRINESDGALNAECQHRIALDTDAAAALRLLLLRLLEH